jgi:hypothetical protein
MHCNKIEKLEQEINELEQMQDSFVDPFNEVIVKYKCKVQEKINNCIKSAIYDMIMSAQMALVPKGCQIPGRGSCWMLDCLRYSIPLEYKKFLLGKNVGNIDGIAVMITSYPSPSIDFLIDTSQKLKEFANKYNITIDLSVLEMEKIRLEEKINSFRADFGNLCGT